jgi:hypothetical protein
VPLPDRHLAFRCQVGEQLVPERLGRAECRRQFGVGRWFGLINEGVGRGGGLPDGSCFRHDQIVRADSLKSENLPPNCKVLQFPSAISMDVIETEPLWLALHVHKGGVPPGVASGRALFHQPEMRWPSRASSGEMTSSLSLVINNTGEGPQLGLTCASTGRVRQGSWHGK